VTTIVGKGSAVGTGFRCHLQEQGNIHNQSEEGSFLVSLVISSNPL